MHIVALTTCHNRCEKTIQSLQALYLQELSDKYSLEIVVVDDGSTDETSSAIKSMFPNVEILEGSGELYWAGGMRFGWEKAIRHKSFDYLFVYNDDVHLNHDALSHLLDVSKLIREKEGPLHVIAGAFSDQSGELVTYGGENQKRWWHPLRFKKIAPNGEPQQVDTLNMNGALITSETLNKIGFFAGYFKHNVADYEFGLRLRKAGGSVWLSSRWIGWCDYNPTNGSGKSSSMSMKQQFRRLLTVKGEPPYQRFRYYADHGGIFWLLLWPLPYIRVTAMMLFERCIDFMFLFFPKGQDKPS